MTTIVNVGDSILGGAGATDQAGVRGHLDTLLPGGGQVWVGSKTDASGRAYECYSGANVATVRSTAQPLVDAGYGSPAALADIAFYMGGTNDTYTTPVAKSVLSFAGEMVWRGIYVVIIGVPRTSQDPAVNGVTTYNAYLSANVSLLGPNAEFIDPFVDIIYPDEFGDTIHPNDDGYARAAAVLATRFTSGFPTYTVQAGLTGAGKPGVGDILVTA